MKYWPHWSSVVRFHRGASKNDQSECRMGGAMKLGAFAADWLQRPQKQISAPWVCLSIVCWLMHAQATTFLAKEPTEKPSLWQAICLHRFLWVKVPILQVSFVVAWWWRVGWCTVSGDGWPNGSCGLYKLGRISLCALQRPQSVNAARIKPTFGQTFWMA